jgi:hypothetical protein
VEKEKKVTTRSERVEGLLKRDWDLMARLRTATPGQQADLLRQRKQVKSQMNLYAFMNAAHCRFQNRLIPMIVRPSDVENVSRLA